ncbi:unnamed protein product [Rhizophagus irregularis]|nr:unnamed protein product [Rhizophagus irregularis]
MAATAVVSDETKDTYQWILECLLCATNGLAPRVLFTDADAGMVAAIHETLPSTKHNYCIWHLRKNLEKNLKGKLHKKYNDFIKEWNKCRNSFSEEEFQKRWHELLTNYPEAQKYLERALGTDVTGWALCFTHRSFNAGVQSTQRVESYNALIKKSVGRSTTLYELDTQIQLQLDKEEKFERLEEQINQNPKVGLPNIIERYFKRVDSIIKKYLTPHVLKMQRHQMNESLLYRVKKIENWELLLEHEAYDFDEKTNSTSSRNENQEYNERSKGKKRERYEEEEREQTKEKEQEQSDEKEWEQFDEERDQSDDEERDQSDDEKRDQSDEEEQDQYDEEERDQSDDKEWDQSDDEKWDQSYEEERDQYDEEERDQSDDKEWDQSDDEKWDQSYEEERDQYDNEWKQSNQKQFDDNEYVRCDDDEWKRSDDKEQEQGRFDNEGVEKSRMKQKDSKVKFAEDDYESKLSNLRSLILYLGYTVIQEVWSVTTIEKNKEHFVHLRRTCNRNLQQKNAPDDDKLVYEHQIRVNFDILNEIRHMQLFSETVKQNLSHKAKYNEGFGYAKKAIGMSLELGCENEINEILQSWIRKKEREICDKQQGCTIGFKENLPNISNPHQARTKGAPKKRVKNALKNTTIKYNNNKNRQDMMKLNVKAPNKQSRSELQPEIPIRQTKYICSYCKGNGHNTRSCELKKKGVRARTK